MLAKVVAQEQFDVVSAGTNTAVGLCFSCVAVLVAQLLPPFSTKRMIDSHFKQSCVSLAFLVRNLGKEFSHQVEHLSAQKKSKVEFEMRTKDSIPLHIKSDPMLMGMVRKC